MYKKFNILYFLRTNRSQNADFLKSISSRTNSPPGEDFLKDIFLRTNCPPDTQDFSIFFERKSLKTIKNPNIFTFYYRPGNVLKV